MDGHSDPAGQSTHATAFADEYFPCGHAVFPVPSIFGHIIPAGQPVHVASLTKEYVPELQGLPTDTNSPELAGHALPAGQCVQLDEPAAA